jgi:hypothetical protein
MEQMRLMAAGRGDGIDLDSTDRWVVDGLREPDAFFQHLHELIPDNSILYFETNNPAPEIRKFFEENRALAGAVCVVRDMIFPIPEVFHVQLRPGLIQELQEILSRHPLERCFANVKAYRNGQLLFAFHDAFDGSSFPISDRVSVERVEAFCVATGSRFRREPNLNKRDPEELRRVLWAMENPNKLKKRWPWWKRTLLFWKK